MKEGDDMVNKNAVLVRKMVFTAIFAALSIVVGFFEIIWLPLPFLKIDFSEVIILVSLLMVGLPRTVIVIILRSLVRELTTPKPFEPIPIVGEVMAILGSLALIVLYRVIVIRKKNKANEGFSLYCLEAPENVFISILKSGLVAIGFSLFMTALNFFVTVPIFLSGLEHFHFISFIKDPAFVGTTQGTLWGYTTFILTGFLPFNLVKGALTMIVFDIIKVGLSQLQDNEKTIQ